MEVVGDAASRRPRWRPRGRSRRAARRAPRRAPPARGTRCGRAPSACHSRRPRSARSLRLARSRARAACVTSAGGRVGRRLACGSPASRLAFSAKACLARTRGGAARCDGARRVAPPSATSRARLGAAARPSAPPARAATASPSRRRAAFARGLPPTPASPAQPRQQPLARLRRGDPARTPAALDARRRLRTRAAGRAHVRRRSTATRDALLRFAPYPWASSLRRRSRPARRRVVPEETGRRDRVLRHAGRRGADRASTCRAAR